MTFALVGGIERSLQVYVLHGLMMN